jgi:hypothetical protein
MNLDKINNTAAEKTRAFVEKLKANQDALGMKHGPDSLKKIRSSQSSKFGLVHRIRIKFKRSGVFRHKGVGKGTKASQVGTTNRQPADWFNSEAEAFADDLASEMADQLIDITFDQMKIR